MSEDFLEATQCKAVMNYIKNEIEENGGFELKGVVKVFKNSDGEIQGAELLGTDNDSPYEIKVNTKDSSIEGELEGRSFSIPYDNAEYNNEVIEIMSKAFSDRQKSDGEEK
ncbi:MAG: hypothetical protein U9Q90_03855 [Campylobacterota bacterium]|nr:hypothetical protein [Campylobacterota bacterium]